MSVEAQILKAEKEVSNLENKLEVQRNSRHSDSKAFEELRIDLAAKRKKEEQLRTKEEQLRTKEEQLRTENLLLLDMKLRDLKNRNEGELEFCSQGSYVVQ